MKSQNSRLVRMDDVLRIYEKIKQGYLSKIALRLSPFKSRVKSAWSHTSHPPKHWGSIQLFKKEWNRAISGDARVNAAQYLASTYPELNGAKALSIACGSGGNEIGWARVGQFSDIHAFDISPSRIESAKRQAAHNQLKTPIHFFVASFEEMASMQEQFDVVLAENALHHAQNLRAVVTSITQRLRPGGFLILREFVGPSRFQWTDRQIEESDRLLERLPTERRLRWKSETLKTRVYRPGTLSMWLGDPSEAAHSDEILEELGRHFECVERKPLGGTLLQLVYDDIAQHFLDDSAETAAFLQDSIDQEKALIESKSLPSDFVFGVFRLRAAPKG